MGVFAPQRVDIGEPGEQDERRANIRTTAIFAYGKLRVGGGEQLCQVRDISPWGARIETRAMPAVGERVSIEMRGLEPSLATVIWSDSKGGGLVFDDERDIDQVFELRRDVSGQRPRSPRFALGMPGELECAGASVAIEVTDISMSGLKLRGASELGVGTWGIVRLAGLPEDVPGHIRWRADETGGFRFDLPLLRDDLFNLLCARA